MASLIAASHDRRLRGQEQAYPPGLSMIGRPRADGRQSKLAARSGHGQQRVWVGLRLARESHVKSAAVRSPFAALSTKSHRHTAFSLLQCSSAKEMTL
jgi:hypothetical protein